MSFRAAYHSLSNSNYRKGYSAGFKDKTSEQEKKELHEYYVRMQQAKAGGRLHRK